MLYRVGLVVGLSIVSLAGCNSLSISNNSLAYKEAIALPPLQLPQNEQTRPIAAIYPVPKVDPAALAQAPEFSNKRGNRFEMPEPKPLDSSLIIGSGTASVGAPSKPTIVTDGNGYPLLKIEGDSNRVWDLLTASLSVGNVSVVDRNQTAGFIIIKQDNKNMYLRLNRSGSITTITVEDEKNALIDKAVAAEILAQLNQNWPA